jgi:hypothetical protein
VPRCCLSDTIPDKSSNVHTDQPPLSGPGGMLVKVGRCASVAAEPVGVAQPGHGEPRRLSIRSSRSSSIRLQLPRRDHSDRRKLVLHEGRGDPKYAPSPRAAAPGSSCAMPCSGSKSGSTRSFYRRRPPYRNPSRSHPQSGFDPSWFYRVMDFIRNSIVCRI